MYFWPNPLLLFHDKESKDNIKAQADVRTVTNGSQKQEASTSG
jgi:hypothetical protein